MKHLLEALEKAVQNGKAAVWVSVVASSGSTPRGAGAHMLVAGEGRLWGTIGGGSVEHHAEQHALEALQTHRSGLQSYQLRQNEVQDLGMVCGGNVDVYFRYIPPEDTQISALCRQAQRLSQQDGPSWLLLDITPDQSGAMALYSRVDGLYGAEIPSAILTKLGDKPAQLSAEGRTFYCEPLQRPGFVYIFGGGHVSQALVPVLAAVDFRCVILEDRPEFCRPELFPGATQTRLIDNRRVLDFASITQDDYVVIMTRGHKDDLSVQAQVLHAPARYIGVIGSRRKAATVFASLREMGFTDAQLARVITPIGLDIQAETPAEIAISIAAQLIWVRAGGGPR